MKRKDTRKITGFTLIELLAVIVILAIIALISTPIIIGVIEKARRGAFEDSAYGVLDAGKLYFTEKLADDNSFSYTEFNFNGDMKDLKLSGEKPAGGTLLIDSDGKQALAIYDKDKKWCAVKTFSEEKIRMIDHYKKCDKDIAENLIINGYGEYGDNTNFSELKFADGSFSTNQEGANIYSSIPMPIDPTKKYSYSIEAKSTSAQAIQYIGLSFLDIDQKEILGFHVQSKIGSLTTLTQDLQKGDTNIYVESLDGFINVDFPVLDGLVFWDYKDSTGYLYPPETYSRNIYRYILNTEGLDRINHVIHLTSPWAGSNIPKGTKVSQSNYGASRQYSLLRYDTLGSSFQKLETILSPEKTDLNQKVWNATKYVKFYAISNHNGDGITPVPGAVTTYKNIVLKQINT